MIWLLLALALLDPAGDDRGPGYAYPTAPVYQEVGFADLTGFEVTVQDANLVLSVRLDRYPNPAEAPLGFSLPVIAIYVDTGPGGEEVLPGAGLRTPKGQGWERAYLLTGWGAEARAPGVLPRPVRAERDGEWIRIHTDLPPGPYGYYVAVGLYDPFEPWGFRAVRPGGGPWRLEGPEAAPRAVDVLARNQAAVYASGVLPPARAGLRFSLWRGAALGLWALGGLALFLAFRRSRRPHEPQEGVGNRQ
ncbi:glucodextranase DOMON-like domain-containing protein [Marinithermus hydrothermalis]|uniref:Glucodextranase-like C-terminal domain-containing protein n=1 Tax=Marinithermus hydrothermalis (strain DSM 14884 / JCM 11576 / T1) TaxID=869210 RepID=F2NKS8_MARHT|nr:glucodextranase DOMON-like domain-containing protein [Marinithermus hydrothermalis]AEB10841.1 Protein of unknown function DUF2223 [Marinithermus hydrothermalis DSM 14884]